jgi:hypothetical protein
MLALSARWLGLSAMVAIASRAWGFAELVLVGFGMVEDLTLLGIIKRKRKSMFQLVYNESNREAG